MGNIDWDFILNNEGGLVLEGYVPDAEGSQSGVTVAGGVDLGQRSSADLKGLSPALVKKLKPFLGLKGEQALAVASNLVLSPKEAQELTEHAKQQTLNKLNTQWQKKTGMKFSEIPMSKATPIASVAFQYGDLPSKTPNFWEQVTADDWEAAIANLNNFGDRYPTRRRSEANYYLNNTPEQEASEDELQGSENWLQRMFGGFFD